MPETIAVPAVERVALTPEDIHCKDYAAALVITNEDDYRRAGEYLIAAKAMRRKIEEHYDRILAPLNETRATVLRMKHDDLDPVVEIETALNRRAGEWFTAEQARIDAENERRQRELDAQAEAQRIAELSAIEGHAEAVDDPIERAALRREADALTQTPVTPAIAPQTNVARVGGLSHPMLTSCQVDDVRVLCKAIGAGKISSDAVIGLDRDKKTGIVSSPWLNREAKQRGDAFNIPGCRVRKVPTSRGRF